MSESDLSQQTQPSSGQEASADLQRREALIKLGKYTAYATPILLASVSWPHAQGADPPPAPPPAPKVLS